MRLREHQALAVMIVFATCGALSAVAQNKLSEGNAEAGTSMHGLSRCRAGSTFQAGLRRIAPSSRFQGHRKQAQTNGCFVETFSRVSAGSAERDENAEPGSN